MEFDVMSALRGDYTKSRDLRMEARSYFYAPRKSFVSAEGYEYLAVIVGWLDGMGWECREFLRKVCFSGLMWYRPTHVLTAQLHDPLRECTGLLILSLQLNIRHLYEAYSLDLDTYLRCTKRQLRDCPLPPVNVGDWAKTVVELPALACFNMDIVFGADTFKVSNGEELNYRAFGARGNRLTEQVGRELKQKISELSPGNEVVVKVRYIGGDERMYYGVPW
ncbi:hypothetical protein CC86DRAFT_436609 [Ophiobolus disseminans]|uniref:Uncharacterized protein n=1 Tax=Ophiobolus disseminans TaxID=1469910 RepID=A0A6A7A850_9PLEO|nr:hypothetical protein CC86DRAFT_436609 [Ophiobolus disseminans]